MSQSELTGVTPEDYIEMSGSPSMWYRTFQLIPGSNEHFVRIIVDHNGDCDGELTFGPMSAEHVDMLATVLLNTFVHYAENWDGPRYESIIAQTLELSGKKGG